MIRFSRLLVTSVILSVTLFTTACGNQSQSVSSENEDKSAQSSDASEDDSIDLQALTCTEFLQTSGEERANILIFMHGFMNGKKGDTTINAPALAEATDKIIDTCIDNSNEKLASVFEKNR